MMATIDDYKSAWAKANAAGDKAGMDAAHAGAEAVRAQQGYSGGADGSQYTPLSGASPNRGYASAGIYNDQGISAQDAAKIKAAKQQYASKQADFLRDGVLSPDEQQVLHSIHNTAEMIRGNYNYSGGVDGSEYIPAHTDRAAKSPIYSATSQESYVNSLYEAQRKAALAALKSAYEQNVIDLDAQAAKIPQTYQAARNQTAAAAQQGQAAFDERAAAMGLNSGAGGQAALTMTNQNTANQNAINTQEANAINDLDTMRLKVSTAYQNDIAQAIAQGDIARAQALYQEAIRVDNGLVQQSASQADENYRYWSANSNQQLQTAETLAKFGDFSGYLAAGYTPQQVEYMKQVWSAANPKISGGGSYSGSGYGGGGTKPETGEVDFGSGAGTPATSDRDSASVLSALQSKLGAVEDRNVSVQASAVALIKSYLQNGLISEATAKRMLSNYGL